MGRMWVVFPGTWQDVGVTIDCKGQLLISDQL